MRRIKKCKICDKTKVVAFRVFGTDLQNGGDVCKPCGRTYAIESGCEFCHCGQELWRKKNKLGLYCNRCQNKCFECVQVGKIKEAYKVRDVFEDILQEQRIEAYNNVLKALLEPDKHHLQGSNLTPIELVKSLIEKEYWQ